AALAKLGEQRVQTFALGNEHGRAHQRLDVEPGAIADELLEHVFREHDADDFVAIVADYREARVVRFADDFQNLFGRLILRHDHHVAARHHDVARLRVRDREHTLQHGELIRTEHAAFDEPRQELDDLLAILDVPATLNEPGPPARYTGVAWVCFV